MSISEALRAASLGDNVEAKRLTDLAVLKAAVSNAIFCSCGAILDVRRAVLVTGVRSAAACGPCHDAVIAKFTANTTPDQLRGMLAKLEILDGRLLSRRPRKARTPPLGRKPSITGEAVNTVTGEKRPVAMSEVQVSAVLNDDEHAVCAGECECQIEPDGVCPKGWPSVIRAVGMV